MSLFPRREKNVTISVRCGARCRADIRIFNGGRQRAVAQQCGGPILVFGFFTFPWRSTTLLGPSEPLVPRTWGKRRRRWDQRGASPLANPYSFVRKHHAYRPGSAFGGWDVVLHRPQPLISSSGSTTPIVPDLPSAAGTWCFTPRKASFLRPEAPRLSSRICLRRLGRGASLPANPYSFVRKHHVARPGQAFGAPGVVPHHPLALVSSSGSTTPSGPAEPPAPRAYLFLMRDCDEYV